MSRRWKLFFFILLIASITIQVYSIYAYTDAENRSKGSWCYKVHPLDYIPDDYWNLTNPDAYILEAIQNPDEWTLPFNLRNSTFWYTAPWREHWSTNTSVGNIRPVPLLTDRRPKPFLYNETCYNYDFTCAGSEVVVNVLSEPPEKYWNITNLDKRLLWGVNNPGKPFRMLSFDNEYPAPPSPFLYNGTYYDYMVVAEIDYFEYPFPTSTSAPKPEHTAMVLASAWIAVGSVYIVKNRKTKAET